MIAYFVLMGAGALLATLLFSLRLGKGKASQALLTLGLMIPFGFFGAKLVYVLAMAGSQFPRYGLGALIRINAEEFSVFGGALGVIGAVLLAARLLRQDGITALDRFAPAGMLMLAVTRASEAFLSTWYIHHGLIGLGRYLPDDHWACFFPVAVQDEWEVWFIAIFTFETLIALISFLLSLKRRKHNFLQSVFFIMAFQIICESLHSQSIRWGFVRVEQLLCALGVLAIIAIHARAAARQGVPAKKRVSLFVWMFLMIVLDVAVEFALDKTAYIMNWLGLDVPEDFPLDQVILYGSYGVMLLSILGMFLVEKKAMHLRKD